MLKQHILYIDNCTEQLYLCFVGVIKDLTLDPAKFKKSSLYNIFDFYIF